MKDIVFEQDYSNDKLYLDQSEATAKRAMSCAVESGVYRSIDERLQTTPHIINPKNKANYDKAVSYLQYIAMMRGGKIKSVVSYERYEATIDLVLPFHEYSDNLKKYIAFIFETARCVNIYPEKEGGIRLAVRYNYFELCGNIDEIIGKEVAEIPELADALMEHNAAEREAALSNPDIYNMLAPAAERAGMTVEEYYDFFDKAMREHPDEFMEMIIDSLTASREKQTEDKE